MSTPTRLQCATDSRYGGRWTSLRGGGREWLWSRPEPQRLAARPGTAFADAGGLEELDTLRMRLEAEGQPTSVALWRNMVGFPPSAPYRSLGIEPMLGTVFDLAEADDTESAIVPPAGVLRWHLTVTAEQDRTQTKGT
ncbi:hypothetical protein [Streptomyces sp. NPDC048637]|uniref:hypothetical protein n=1 Tax=Streptomyces sp. NPDC048637 TaxID=3155636 RepID=UPI00343F9A82